MTNLSKKEQFEYILSNIQKLSHLNQHLKTVYNRSQRLCFNLNTIGIEIPMFDTHEDIRKYFTGEKAECIICGNDTLLSSRNLNAGFRRTCCKLCFNKDTSNRQKKDNTVHRVKDKKAWSEMVSNRLKLAISEGRFTPSVTNSWCNSRIGVLIGSKIINVRSSWEAYFLLKNPTFSYEKTRIPYIDLKGTQRTYIVDFTDNKGNLFEIKPSSKLGESSPKIEYAKNYAEKNHVNFTLVTEDYFNDIDISIVAGQPQEELLIKRLKRYENKKNN